VFAFDASDRTNAIVTRDVGERAAPEAPALRVIAGAMYIGYVEDGAVVVERANLVDGIPQEFTEFYRVLATGADRLTVALDALPSISTDPARLGVAWLEGAGASAEVTLRVVMLKQSGMPERTEFEGAIGPRRARQALTLTASTTRREWLVASTATAIDGGYAGIASQLQTGAFIPFSLTCAPN
jgi:hypothetical protein